jgi:predicted site-specific integrase-resolvase
MGRRRIYENPAARTRAYRARRRLRLEARAFAALPLHLVRADPAAAATVLAGELGPEAASRLRQALSTALANQAIDALQQELAQRGLAQQELPEQALDAVLTTVLAKQGLTEQDDGLARCLAALASSDPPIAGNEPPVPAADPPARSTTDHPLIPAAASADHLPATVVGLARVSGPGQEIELSRQEEQIEAFCAAQGWRYEILSDSGSGLDDGDGSGPGSSKKGLKRLLELILCKRASRLVVTHKDRLAPGLDGSEIIVSLCEIQKIEIVVLNQGDDPPTLGEEESAQDIELRQLCERLVKNTDAGDACVPQATAGAFHFSGTSPVDGNGKDGNGNDGSIAK